MKSLNLSALAVLLSTVGNALIDFSETMIDDAEGDEPEAAPAKETGKASTKAADKAPAKARGGKAKPEPEPEPEPAEDDPVSLEDLQGLVATLLENGKRKIVNGILADFKAKAISAVEESDYDEIYDRLYDEVEALEA